MGPEKCSNQHKMEKKPGLDPERNKRNKEKQNKEKEKEKEKERKSNKRSRNVKKGPVITTNDVPCVFVSRVADMSIQLAPRCHARTGLEP